MHCLASENCVGCPGDRIAKDRFCRSHPIAFEWRGSWRCTFLNLPEFKSTRIPCKNLFSDVLHRPFLCAHTPLQSYTIGIPARNRIPRLPDLSTDDFAANWTDKPFILTDVVQKWPVYRDWSTAALLNSYGELQFTAEAVNWPLKTYVQYMNNNEDESPLYLFDCAFVEKMKIKTDKSQGRQYWAPECFGEDLFSVLGDRRPDSRWLIVGPERSGSTFHKDPNATRFVVFLLFVFYYSLTVLPALGTLFFVARSTGLCFPLPRRYHHHQVFLFPRIRARLLVHLALLNGFSVSTNKREELQDVGKGYVARVRSSTCRLGGGTLWST